LSEQSQRVAARKRAAAFSILLSVVLLAAKVFAWRLTASTAILSDAIESTINVVAACLAFFSIVQSAKPPDSDHPYGHGKAEDFSAGVEGTLIVIAALLIVWHALHRLVEPRLIGQLDLGLLIILVTSFANGAAGMYLIRQGKSHASQALIADGYHLLTDTVTSAGVVVGLILVRISGWVWLDPLAAIAVAAHILVVGLRLMRQSIGRLMDEADAELLEEIAQRLQTTRLPEWIDLHELRAWRSGDLRHIDLHLTIPRYWTIEQAHDTQAHLKEVLLQPYDGRGECIVHLDPCKPECCHICAVSNCPVREEALQVRPEWTGEVLVLGPKEARAIRTRGNRPGDPR
jgi:cation diffusion facilitator family transporter